MASSNIPIGWPLHITSYGRSASDYLKTHGKGVDDNRLGTFDLEEVLNEGRRRRLEYYKRRLSSFHDEEIEEITKVLNHKTILYPMKSKDIISSFEKEFPIEKSENLYERAVEKGVFHRVKDGRYIVPLPSMKHWLISNQWKINQKPSK
ncbi:MAG: hypothetical protein OXC92_06840 [Flavobacteriaceae bacterium]|nr:hypothetical protein [Flavobacteriaceae bacterium]MCY4216680.1 hypothetical protein [Flavobacteriaceae bacterium]MCY4254068.1 hypothetical protein [Flavobacteriaceae bacterium]